MTCMMISRKILCTCVYIRAYYLLLHGKNSFTQESKNSAKYRFKNTFIGLSK